ncbi:MAG: PAS domain-containing sensor histidine kinase [Henriciella sp.]|jgi:two-component system nitrogen regulation sensor histidine kinase GlnL|uniref:two-component system sensor histidine kinase NtrB n=1 Tax=Henriciella sp. TaxID=1968823 RepID=UPI000C0DC108|nr:ATP-binding protein [Henriciella sp.]MAN75274.1 PAS domain-containing sensor histidine kinase [Henriciella sp.]MBF33467.1 PAS domain-containing sensor histidine kinase [Hyphomonadaceae bacterium]PHR79883.1 MAG: PAS domain-containing sensor histidine kinase [Henriciella sp.]|tara:strand:+ start:2127 stop:3179 length:1053 start_codon:yes stop_codon:yes gene_type:complete
MSEKANLSDLAPFAIIHLDPRRVILTANTEAQILLGHSLSSLQGRNLSEFIYHDSPIFELLDRVSGEEGDVNAHGVVVSGPAAPKNRLYDVRLRPGPDATIVLAVSETLMRDPSDSAAGISGFGRILGHEVKNPLAGISGAAQLLLRTADDKQAPLLDVIRSEASRIERLVSRLSAFELFSAPRRDRFNIHQLLDKIMIAEEAAHGGNIILKRAYDPSLPEILGDEDHLHEAFQNIVRNAAEAASETGGKGEVTLQTAFETGFAFSSKRNARRLQRAIRVTVEDNGRGISAETRDQMFDMFSSTKAGGRGLGLSVVSEVVAAHEGRIKVESRPGQTKFSVFLPMKRENVQ